MIKTSILFLNDLGLDVRTACERNPTKDTPTANTNTSQAQMLSTPVNSFLRRRDMLVSKTRARCAQTCSNMEGDKYEVRPSRTEQLHSMALTTLSKG